MTQNKTMAVLMKSFKRQWRCGVVCRSIFLAAAVAVLCMGIYEILSRSWGNGYRCGNSLSSPAFVSFNILSGTPAFAFSMKHNEVQQQSARGSAIIEKSTKIVRPLSLFFVPSAFLGDSGNSLINISYAIPHRDLDFQESMFGKGNCPLDIVIDVKSPDGEPVYHVNEQIVVWRSSAGVDSRGYLLADKKIAVLPGVYEIQMQITTMDKSRFGKRNETFTVPSFEANTPLISSIQLAYRIDESGEHIPAGADSALHVVSYPFRKVLRNYPLFAYFEIYNLIEDQSKAFRYSVDCSIFQEDRQVSIFKRITGSGGRRPEIQEILKRVNKRRPASDFVMFDPEKLKIGKMSLVISIQDEFTKSIAEAAVPFEVIASPSDLLQ